MLHFRVSGVRSHLPGKLREACWMAPCHNKGRCCFQTGEDTMLVLKSQLLGGEGGNNEVKFLLQIPLSFACVWTEPYSCRAHQTNRWWTETIQRLPEQRFPVSAMHRPPSMVLVPKKVPYWNLHFTEPLATQILNLWRKGWYCRTAQEINLNSSFALLTDLGSN